MIIKVYAYECNSEYEAMRKRQKKVEHVCSACFALESFDPWMSFGTSVFKKAHNDHKIIIQEKVSMSFVFFVEIF